MDCRNQWIEEYDVEHIGLKVWEMRDIKERGSERG